MTNTLRIDRLSSTYLVPRDHPSPLRLRSELDDLARTYISDSCAAAIGPLLDPADPSVWLIASLQLNLLLDVHAAPPQEIAGLWARGIASSVAHLLAIGEDGTRVLRFANRAAFLAYFLHSLAEDQAWQRWYFSEFDSLRSLPRGAAIREALLREPGQIDAVLLELDHTHALPLILSALTPTDHHRILTCCSYGRPCTPSSFVDIAKSLASGSQPSTLLALYVWIRRAHPHLDVSEAADAAEHFHVLFEWAGTASTASFGMIFDAVAHRTDRALALDPSHSPTLTLLRSFLEQDGPSALKAIAALQRASDVCKSNEHYLSDLGAVFLLTAALLEMPALCSVFADPSRQHLYLLFLTCFSAKVLDAWRDPAPRLAAGLSDLPTPSQLASLELPPISQALIEAALPEDVAYFTSPRTLMPELELAHATQASLGVCAAVLVRSFAQHLPALGGSSIEYLWRNVFSGSSQIVSSADGLTVHLQPRPLQIVLRMAGLHDRDFHLPWRNPARLTLRFDQT